MRVVETEDEHSEARFVAAEIAALIELGYSAREIAVVYRTNAQSRVLEDVLVRQGIAYQVIGGPRFYERAEVKDAIAYLQVLDNPADAVSLTRIANRPAARDRRHVARAPRRLRRRARHRRSGRRPRGRRRPASPPRPSGGQRLPLGDGELMATATDASVAQIVEAVLDRSGYLDALEAERTIEARGRIENLEELVGVAREYDASAVGAVTERLPAGDLALLRPGRDPRRRRERPGDADDAAQREGPRVPRGLHARPGGGDLPARPLDRGELARGGAAARLRRHDAREGAADADARDAAQPLRPQRGEPAVALPRRAAGARASSASGSGRPRGRTTATRCTREFTPRSDVPDLSTGDTVRHQTLGTGIVTQIEAGGVVTVRFEDGSERRLMLEYAPLERI